MNNPEKKEEINKQSDSPPETTGDTSGTPLIEELETTATKPPINDMEVHHHSHAHGKKNWKTYIWEFLMLFLAVFCGFLAEYQLEHTIEHQREKVFVKSMLEDLEDDQVKLNGYFSEVSLGLSQMDSLITILDNATLIKEQGPKLYYLARVSPRLKIFANNTRTLEQLKYSGSFRLIRNAAAANKITAYYGKIGFIHHLEDLYFREFEQYKKIASEILEPSVMRSMELPEGDISRVAINASLRTNDENKIKDLAVYAVYMNGSRRSMKPAAKELEANGRELINFLKKQYHLD